MPKIVTIICPICENAIEIPEYNKVTRSDALGAHLKKEHSVHWRLPLAAAPGDSQGLRDYYKVPPEAY